MAFSVLVHERWHCERDPLRPAVALRCERQALPSCVMWPTATPVLHITRGFAIVRCMLAAHTTQENFFADASVSTSVSMSSPASVSASSSSFSCASPFSSTPFFCVSHAGYCSQYLFSRFPAYAPSSNVPSTSFNTYAAPSRMLWTKQGPPTYPLACQYADCLASCHEVKQGSLCLLGLFPVLIISSYRTRPCSLACFS